MTTQLPPPEDINNLLTIIPKSLRDELFQTFNSINNNYREERWEPSELNGGKLCEVVYTILRGYIDGSIPNTSCKPANMVDACRALEQAPPTFPRSIRIQLPRMLIALYEIRNNRGVGHIGGDINPNRMDATCVLYMTKWIIAELIRLFHNVDPIVAEKAVEWIVERTIPVVWKISDKRRILDTKLSMKERTLLLLYNTSTYIQEQELINWIEHSNASVYRRDVLRPLHREKFIEYDEENKRVYLSPTGVKQVEKVILIKNDTSRT